MGFISKKKALLKKGDFDGFPISDMSILSEFKGKIIDDKKYWTDFFREAFNNRFETSNSFDACEFKVDTNIELKLDDDNKIAFNYLPLNHFKNIYFIDVYSDSGNTDGFNVIDAIRKINKFVPIIVFSSSENPIIIKKAFEKRCNGFFMKDRDSLSDLINIIKLYTTSEKLSFIRMMSSLHFYLTELDDEKDVFEYRIPILVKEKNTRGFNRTEEERLVLKELPDHDRIEAMNIIEELSNCNSELNNSQIHKILRIFFGEYVEKIRFNYDLDLLEQILEKTEYIFNSYKKNKEINFASIRKILDDTVVLFNDHQLVDSEVVRIDDSQVKVKIIRTDLVYNIPRIDIEKYGESITNLALGQKLIVFKQKKHLGNHNKLDKIGIYKILEK